MNPLACTIIIKRQNTSGIALKLFALCKINNLYKYLDAVFLLCYTVFLWKMIVFTITMQNYTYNLYIYIIGLNIRPNYEYEYKTSDYRFVEST